MKNTCKNQYILFKEKQLRLAAMMTEAAKLLSGLGMTSFTDTLNSLGDKLRNDNFKIQVIGTFKNGKSTFINSFLGEEILPAYALPCTAVINEVKYGREKKAVLHFKNPLPEKLPADIPQKALEHMNRFPDGKIPPMEIPYDEIEDYVVIPIGKDPREMLLESPYDKVELFWPLDLLENGIEIIDSPGLNEHATRTKVTLEYLTGADAILFVLNAVSLCSLEEMKFIETTLKGHGFDEIFFVVNRFDLISENEKQSIVDYANAKLEKYTGFGKSGISFVSALDALDGKTEGDEDLVNGSGMVEFEDDLSEYLTHNKGKAKLMQPAKELKRILSEEAILKTVPRQKAMLVSSLDEIKDRYETILPILENLRLRKEMMYNRLTLRIEQLKSEFKRIVSADITDLSQRIPEWIDSYEPKAKIGMLPSKEKVGAVTSEIADFVYLNSEAHQQKWRQEVLIPFIEEKAKTVFESVEADLTGLLCEIDNVQLCVTGEESDGGVSVSAWERVILDARDLTIHGDNPYSGSGLGRINKNLAKSIGISIGATVFLASVNCLNPVGFVLTLLGGSIFAVSHSDAESVKKLKSAMSAEMVNNLTMTAEETAESTSGIIIEKINETAKKITGSVDAQIEETRKQFQSVIEEKEKGEQSVREKEAQIDKCKADIQNLCLSLDSLIADL